jgi:Asp-tRNA(Asn)/Glu-tRNA(Gln) amidotransferase A subunit family amidase
MKASQYLLPSFCDMQSQFLAGESTPSLYLEKCINAIGAREREIGAFVVMQIEVARQAAEQASRRWRQGTQLSCIDGLPIGIKDIIETRDMPTQMGSPIFAGWSSHRDAASVAALRECGAIIFGKTVTTEFAAPVPRGTRNPLDHLRTPGGSSSGSAAAVGAGMLPVAIGTQGIGSILRPASYCGCIGFKPSLGSLNRGGSHDNLSQSTHGVLASSLSDAWSTVFQIAKLAGGDPGFTGLLGPEGLPKPKKMSRIAILETAGWGQMEEGVQQQFESFLLTLTRTGIQLFRRQDFPLLEEVEVALTDALPGSSEINAWESVWPLNDYSLTMQEKLSPLMLERLSFGRRLGVNGYRSAIEQRTKARETFAQLRCEVDLVLTLSATGPAPIGLASTGNTVFNVPASYLGVPALSLPLLEVNGLPLGLQCIGFQDFDVELLAFSSWLMAEYED